MDVSDTGVYYWLRRPWFGRLGLVWLSRFGNPAGPDPLPPLELLSELQDPGKKIFGEAKTLANT